MVIHYQWDIVSTWGCVWYRNHSGFVFLQLSRWENQLSQVTITPQLRQEVCSHFSLYNIIFLLQTPSNLSQLSCVSWVFFLLQLRDAVLSFCDQLRDHVLPLAHHLWNSHPWSSTLRWEPPGTARVTLSSVWSTALCSIFSTLISECTGLGCSLAWCVCLYICFLCPTSNDSLEFPDLLIVDYLLVPFLKIELSYLFRIWFFLSVSEG